MPNPVFTDRTVVLVGGGSGIGLATARLVTAGGGAVLLGGRNEQRLAAAAESLGPSAHWHRIDTGDQSSVDAFFDGVEVVHGLLTTAAEYATGPMGVLSIDQAATAFDSKFWGQYRVTRAALPKLSPDAAIVLMSGAAGARPAADRTAAFDGYRAASVIGRLATEDEIAHTVAYLLTTRVTTGSTLYRTAVIRSAEVRRCRPRWRDRCTRPR